MKPSHFKILAATSIAGVLMFSAGYFFNKVVPVIGLKNSCKFVDLTCEQSITVGEVSGFWHYASAVFQLANITTEDFNNSPLANSSDANPEHNELQEFSFDGGWYSTNIFDNKATGWNRFSYCFTGKTRELAKNNSPGLHLERSRDQGKNNDPIPLH